MLIQAEVPEEFVDNVARAVVERVIELVEARDAEKQYMDVARAASYLSCSKGRLYELSRRCEVPHFKLGSRLLFSSRELDDWLLSQRAEASPPAFADEKPRRRVGGAPAPQARTEQAETKSQTRKKLIPPPLSFSDEQKQGAAKALGLSRKEFDQLSPREYDLLWKERVRQLATLTDEEREVLFEWDPNVAKLSEMTVDEMKELAAKLGGRRSTRDAS